jgi:hypothetical protein
MLQTPKITQKNGEELRKRSCSLAFSFVLLSERWKQVDERSQHEPRGGTAVDRTHAGVERGPDRPPSQELAHGRSFRPRRLEPVHPLQPRSQRHLVSFGELDQF